MLRAFVIGLGVAFIFGAVVLAVAVPRAWFVAFELFLLGIVLLAGLFFEGRYRGRSVSASKKLQATGERFVDPTTGKLTEVLYDPQTGERVYRVVS